jgi:hypothetical protein
MTALVSQFYDAVSVGCGGDLDHSALLTFFEKLADYTVGVD